MYNDNKSMKRGEMGRGEGGVAPISRVLNILSTFMAALKCCQGTLAESAPA